MPGGARGGLVPLHGAPALTAPTDLPEDRSGSHNAGPPSALPMARPEPPGRDDFVSLEDFSDPVSAEMVADVLRQEGIAVTVSGLHHTGLLGVAGGIIGTRVQVRRSQRVQAIELLEALRAEDAEVIDDPAVPVELRAPRRPEGPVPDPAAGPYRHPGREDDSAEGRRRRRFGAVSPGRVLLLVGIGLALGYAALLAGAI